MNAYTPKTIAQYLDMLKDALRGADASLIRDALYDAEEHLRSELAANPGVSEAELLAGVANSYGAPEEVADIYRDTEVTVQKALTPPKKPAQASAFKRFFAVAVDPHTYGAVFYMLLSLATGIFYFTWVTTGLSMSAGLMILIIGIPFFILFMASVYAISLVEGRLVETLLGVRTPISRLRGHWHEYQGVKLMPTLHPAYLLRNPNDKRLVWEDVKMVLRELGHLP